MDLTEKLMYITVQVRCELTDGGLSRGSGFIFTYSKGTDIPTTQQLVSSTDIMVNLGNVIKSKKLEELGVVLWNIAEG